MLDSNFFKKRLSEIRPRRKTQYSNLRHMSTAREFVVNESCTQSINRYTSGSFLHLLAIPALGIPQPVIVFMPFSITKVIHKLHFNSSVHLPWHRLCKYEEKENTTTNPFHSWMFYQLIHHHEHHQNQLLSILIRSSQERVNWSSTDQYQEHKESIVKKWHQINMTKITKQLLPHILSLL